MTRHFLKDDDLSPGRAGRGAGAGRRRSRRTRHTAEAPTPLAAPTGAARGRRAVRQALDPHPGLLLVGVAELGGYPLVIDAASSQLGRGEPVEDTTRVLDRQAAAIVWRTFGQDRIEAMASVSRVPVVNALTDEYHPCQILADLQTVAERKGSLRRPHADLPRRRRQQHGALLPARRRDGRHARADRLAGGRSSPTPPSSSGPRRSPPRPAARCCWTADPAAAADGADVLATDTWVSMGQEDEYDARIAPFLPYAVDDAALARAADDAVVLHCLPAYRGKEIAAEVIDGPQSAVWDEAENRLHAQKALLALAAGAHPDDDGPHPSRPGRRGSAELIEAQPVTSQTQLAALLAESGIEVTQATLSRDLEELGAVKLRGSDGAPASYVLPPENAPLRPAQAAPARLTRLLADLLTNAEGSANLAVLRTPAGRRAVPRLGAGQGRPPRRPGHDRGGRHSARRLPRPRRRTGPGRPPARARRAHARHLPRTEDRPGRECTVTERVVLAYSGGLDTSVAIGWIAEETGAEVIAVAGDVGQGGEDLDVIRQRALDCGAVESIVADMRDEFADEFCLPALKANALYMDRYPLVSALSRPLIVKHLVAAAKYHGASMVAHGCTGKGNDQVRFEVGIGALGPDLRCSPRSATPA